MQKLAVLQSFDDKQMIATCEAALAALLPFAKAVLRLAQELQAMEAASLAIGCAKATLRCSRTMRSLSTALLPHLQAADSPLLGRDVLACLAAFGASSVVEDDFLTAASGFLRSLDLEEVDLWEALQHLPQPKAARFIEVLNLELGGRGAGVVLKFLATGGRVQPVRAKLLQAFRGPRMEQLPCEPAVAMKLAGLLEDQALIDSFATVAAASAKSWQRRDVLACADAISSLPMTNAT